jgi:hypothetical protein
MTGENIELDPTPEQRKKVLEWMQEQRALNNLALRFQRLESYVPVAMDIPQKVRQLAQIGCNACEVVVFNDGSMPLNVASKPIQLSPWTRQSLRDRNKPIVDAMKDQLVRSSSAPWGGPICMTVAAVEPPAGQASKKDVDNLVKGLLDGLHGVLYDNDSQIQCLTTRRFEYAGAIGYYLVSARAVYPWDNDVVYDNPKAPVIYSGQVILPEMGEQ